MAQLNAPDLGFTFSLKGKALDRLSKEKAEIIHTFCRKNRIQLINPLPAHLGQEISKRMTEQGRFIGLRVRFRTKDAFLKFPLGGASAREIARREACVYAHIFSTHASLSVGTFAEALPTPFGYALLRDFFFGKRLDTVAKTPHIIRITSLLKNISEVPIAPVAKDCQKMLYGVYTSPIHSFCDYEKEVYTRVHNYTIAKHTILSPSQASKILSFVSKYRLLITSCEDTPVFAHRDFFDKNLLITPTDKIALIDFEHGAIVKNRALGLTFDLANLIVQWYRYPRITDRITQLVRQTQKDIAFFDTSLRVNLVIQILAKIDPLAQSMTPGGEVENKKLLTSVLHS